VWTGGKGTEMSGAMVTAKTRATVHHGDRELVREFSPVELFTYSSGELDDAMESSGFDQWAKRG
jgi:hypothetical protein